MNVSPPQCQAAEKQWQHLRQIVQQYELNQLPDAMVTFKKLKWQRVITTNILIFFVQYSGLSLSVLTTHLSPLWLATGTSCAYIFLRGLRILPGIWLGTFFAFIVAHAGVLLSIIAATLFSAQAVLLLWFNYHYLNPSLLFYQLRHLTIFILYTLGLTGVISAALFLSCYTGMHPLQNPSVVWLQWWIGNCNGILILSCAFSACDAYFPGTYLIKRISATHIILYSVLIISTLTLCFSKSLISIALFASLNGLSVLWISIQFAWFELMIGMLLSGLILSFAAYMDAPVFTGPTLLFIEMLLFSEAVVGMCLAKPFKPETSV